ncbi:MAG TPA: hypothetical protein VK440_03905 [Burkholderiales bacterium]|nr:hypothetical protein [Burkholderiales bacterium]
MPVTSPPKINTQQGTFAGFFAPAFIFAVVLACQAFWILAAELSRPPLIPFLSDTAADLAANRNAAHLAAKFGIVRGDLWAQDALTYSDVFRREEQSNAVDATTVQEARNIAERALAFAPHDARIWLVLASVVSRFDWLNGKASAALRMSYYTGPNEVALIPFRLMLSLTSPAISDNDFQQLVAHDLRTIVNRRPELKPAVANAYRSASPEGQQFVRDALKDLDPNLLSGLAQKHSEG